MFLNNGKSIVAISNGDPAGVGPEITLKAHLNEELRAVAAPVVIGSPELYAREIKALDLPLELREIFALKDASGDPGVVEILPFDSLDLSACPRGKVSAEGGRYSGASIARAIELGMKGEAQSVVVSPNNKRAMKDGGHEHTGFEEITRHYTGADRSIQILMGRKYNMARVTNHVPLSRVSELCTRDRVLGQIEVLDESLKMVGIARPRIGVSGLNPHNGERGLIGSEDMNEIEPACEMARERGLDVLGPIPGDTVFVDYGKYGFDIVLSMYHDHGNAAIKLLEFGHLVNFIGGLPIPVFTVSHGTAFDIAGKGIADATNMELSIMAAAKAQRSQGMVA
ncbi:4-hydroxythreonine-4-phosphate dehydrogenase PdxA [uncultured Cohaesibacter sp.]|uniref:PdxA family dehydrogenase n=1 Tax=uncultured Cohaesibacter sp. TaxID=1002546 RepID=UPI00292EC122|nr:4-hydroxythreonine-4-phosphate dehydrogenase PdxA [uncultured Cohaesibacter sp.]